MSTEELGFELNVHCKLFNYSEHLYSFSQFIWQKKERDTATCFRFLYFLVYRNSLDQGDDFSFCLLFSFLNEQIRLFTEGNLYLLDFFSLAIKEDKKQVHKIKFLWHCVFLFTLQEIQSSSISSYLILRGSWKCRCSKKLVVTMTTAWFLAFCLSFFCSLNMPVIAIAKVSTMPSVPTRKTTPSATTTDLNICPGAWPWC